MNEEQGEQQSIIVVKELATGAPEAEGQETQYADSTADEDLGVPSECEADKETQATYDQLMEHKRFLQAAGRDIAMLEVQSRELEDFVTHADDYKDDYFDIKQFAAHVGKVWAERLPPSSRAASARGIDQSSPTRRRIFPNQSSILDANAARLQSQADQLQAIDNSYDEQLAIEARSEQIPGMARRIARNEERRRLFDSAMKARADQHASDQALADAVGGGLVVSTQGSQHRPPSAASLPPLMASMTGSKSIAHPAHLMTSADGSKVLGPKRPDGLAALNLTVAAPTPAGLNDSKAPNTTAIDPILSSDFSGKSSLNRPPAVERAAKLAQQQALERKMKAQRAKAIEVFGDEADLAENFGNVSQQSDQSPAKRRSTHNSAVVLPEITLPALPSPPKAHTRLQAMLSEQEVGLTEQERRHTEEYSPMLMRYYEYHDHAQQKLAAIASMTGLAGTGERRSLLPSSDE